jgi:hypothetical protein
MLACCLMAMPVWAQDGIEAPKPAGVVLEDSASPFGPVDLSDKDIRLIILPAVKGPFSASDAADFEKYYYFRRDNTDVRTAFADISECDGYARGLRSNLPNNYTYYYGVGGLVGGAIGSLMSEAIIGSALKREARRQTMRTCMAFKGYDRHGVSKKVWQYFNFEEGLTAVPDGERRRRLLQQAAVAARTPAIGEVLAP